MVEVKHRSIEVVDRSLEVEEPKCRLVEVAGK
jgi:hypothetical protein